MSKNIKHIHLTLRKINQNQLGATIPISLIDKYKLKEGDMLFIPEAIVDEEVERYRCNVCLTEFEFNGEFFCPICDATYISKIIDTQNMKGGEENE